MEDVIYLKEGTIAMIVTLKGTVYRGKVKSVDTLEKETVTLENYSKFEYTLAGYVEGYCNCEITIEHTDVLTCICTDPLFPIITGINTLEEL